MFLQNILYKTLFATNFVRNTCEFYNFVGNNYPRRNYLPIKILRKNSRKKPFLAIFFNRFARKFSCNMRICSSDFVNTRRYPWIPVDLKKIGEYPYNGYPMDMGTGTGHIFIQQVGYGGATSRTLPAPLTSLLIVVLFHLTIYMY